MSYTLYSGDCYDFIKTLSKVNAVITDPPFGTGKLETRGGSYKVKPTKNIFDWDKWDIRWMSMVSFDCATIFTPPEFLAQMLIGNRLLCAVTKQGVCVKNVSPVYRIQPVVLVGKTPVNYKRDWFEYKNTGKHKYHPCEKDIGVMRWLVELSTKPDDIVFDPFMGSGTTGVACVQLGRHFIGCENDSVYYAIAEQRIKDAVYSPVLFSDQEQPTQLKLGE